jgi:hypothetical protein
MNNLIDGSFAATSIFSVAGIMDIVADLGTPTDVGAIGVCGGNPTSQTIYFNAYVSNDKVTWYEAAVNVAASRTESKTNAVLNFTNSSCNMRSLFAPHHDDPIGSIVDPGTDTVLNQKCFVSKQFAAIGDATYVYVAFAETQNVRYIKYEFYGNNSSGTHSFSNVMEIGAFGPNVVK